MFSKAIYYFDTSTNLKKRKHMTVDLSNEKQINEEFIKQCIVRTVGSTVEKTMCNNPDSINNVFTNAKDKDVSIAVFKAAKEQLTADSINFAFKHSGWGTELIELLFDQAEEQITGDSINYVLKDTSMNVEKVKLLFERAKDQFTDESINEAFKNSSINEETLIFLFNKTKDRLTSDSIDYAFQHSSGTGIINFLFDNAKEEIALESIQKKLFIFYVRHDLVVGPKLQHWLSAIKILGNNEAEVASKFKYDSQISALELLGKEKAELALKFTNDEQVKALKKLGIEMAEVSTKFYSMWQNSAIDILGKENAELALKFHTVEHNIVLEALGRENAELALEIVPQLYLAGHGNYEVSYIYKALRLLKDSDNIKLALEFTNNIKIKTLEIIGAKKADLALKIANEIQAKSSLWHDDIIEALKILNNAEDRSIKCTDIPNQNVVSKLVTSILNQSCDIVELAPLFKFISLEALKILSPAKAVLALEIGDDISHNNFEISKKMNYKDKYFETKDRENKALKALEILKDSPNIKHAVKFLSSSPHEMQLLEKCYDNLDCKNKCIDNEEFIANYEGFYHCYSGILATNATVFNL